MSSSSTRPSSSRTRLGVPGVPDAPTRAVRELPGQRPQRQAGDESFRLHLGTGSSSDGSVPIVVRSLVPISRQGGTFSGNLTGGADDRPSSQTFTYQFEVPWGRPSLNLAVQLADANYGVQGWLVDPSGQPVDVQIRPSGSAPRQFFAAHDAVLPPESATRPVDGDPHRRPAGQRGAPLSEPYTGTISFNPPQVCSSGIPNSRHAKLRAGQPVTGTIQVTNTGNSPQGLPRRPRLDHRVPQLLAGVDTNNVALPLSFTAQPNWLVPPGTNGLADGGSGEPADHHGHRVRASVIRTSAARHSATLRSTG